MPEMSNESIYHRLANSISYEYCLENTGFQALRHLTVDPNQDSLG